MGDMSPIGMGDMSPIPNRDGRRGRSPLAIVHNLSSARLGLASAAALAALLDQLLTRAG